MRTSSLLDIGSMRPLSSTTTSDSIVPVRVGRVLLVVCWVAVVSATIGVVPHPTDSRDFGAWIGALLFVLTFTIAVERPAAVRLLYLSGLAGVLMQICAPSNGAFVAVIATIAVAGIRLDAVSSRRVVVLSGAGFLLASALSSRHQSSAQLVSVVPALFFTYLSSTAMRRLRAEQRRTEDLLQEMVAGRDAVIRAAALDERAHVAREMHDVLAHTLSALSIQLEGTRMLAEKRDCDPALVVAVERASGLAKDGLGEARRAVGSLRGEALPGPNLLPQLVQEFERHSGVPCRLQIEGQPVDLPADARLALYRIAQEALTNVRKHSHASSVDIGLRYVPDGIELIVENEGTPLASPLAGGGYGLSGMRERAELLNGKVEAGPTATGYRVWLWTPIEPSGPSAS